MRNGGERKSKPGHAATGGRVAWVGVAGGELGG